MDQRYKNSLKFVWNSFSGHKRMFYVFLAGKVISGIFYVGLPILAKLEMDQLVEKNEELFGLIHLNSFSIFLVILLIIFGIKFIENILQSIIDFFQYDYVRTYDIYFEESLYKKLENTTPGIFLNARNKRLVGDILGNPNKVSETIRTLFGEFISNFFVIIGIVAVLSLINIWIFVVIVVASIIMYFIDKAQNKYSEQESFEEKYDYHEKIWILASQMERNLTNLMMSGGFSFVLSCFSKYKQLLKDRLKFFQKRSIILNLFSFVTENISDILVKMIVGFSIFFSTASVGTMTMSLLYVGRVSEFLSFIRQFRYQYNTFIDNLLKLDIFLELTSEKRDKKLYLEDFEKIEFQDVGFSYPNFAEIELRYLEIIENRIKSYGNGNQEENELHLIAESKKEILETPPTILEKINLVFNKGKTYGLVGKNGAGKTTLTSLLFNSFNNYTGNILIDSKELKEFKRDFFYDNISLVSQIPYVIEGLTIRENLLLGVNKEYEEEYILGLLDKFGLKKKILKNKKGLDVKLGYDNNLSGGEKQLITLIRTILQDRKVVIMDEGTNQLDAENELLVMNELFKHKHNKIIIFITHRMTTIKKSDVIYCLEDGQITDYGDHKTLLSRDNIYSRFWEKQVGE